MPDTETSKRDRVLGDEWEDWSGDLDESVSYRETAVLFTVLALSALVLLIAAGVFVLYMIEPRLGTLHPGLVLPVRVLAVIAALLVAGWFGLLVLGVYTGRNLFFASRMGQVTATLLFPPALALARRFGVSRDRLANSFVRFSNGIIAASHQPRGGRTIILLPRCLRADLRAEIQELADATGVGVFSVGGGGQARRVIQKERPSAVIGVACERDLISGIHDVAPFLPTIGVTNQRPEGPCKNTVIDMDELRRAIHTFTGVSV